MSAVLRLTAESLARSRFAVSPLAETIAAILTLARGDEPWREPGAVAGRVEFQRFLAGDPFAAGFVALISSTKWLPAPITVPPTGGMHTRLKDELSKARTLNDATVIAELQHARDESWQRHDLSWISGSPLAHRIADLVQTAWTRWAQPDWPRRKALLERDVRYRAGLLAAYGWPAAIDRMSRHSRWVAADAIQYSARRTAPARQVGENGLQFVPITRRSTWLAEWPPDDFAIVYPAWGIAEASDQSMPVDGAVDRLLGIGRASVLRELGHPATTSELAVLLGVALGTVGGHLAVLRDNRLVARTRMGNRVVYHRTDLGDRLMDRHHPTESAEPQ